MQVRWGALLHDIGKMGIPDEILLKHDTLTEAEWAVMKKHPVFAYEMLSPIRYLRSALDIPYAHHEKWDGTGYPLGLKGEQIPLVARIFAVVDVWDALRSDRLYRTSWSVEKVREHLRSLAGTHFDPHVVRDVLIRTFSGIETRKTPKILLLSIELFYLRYNILHLGVERGILRPGSHERIDPGAQVSDPLMDLRFEREYFVLSFSLILRSPAFF